MTNNGADLVGKFTPDQMTMYAAFGGLAHILWSFICVALLNVLCYYHPVLRKASVYVVEACRVIHPKHGYKYRQKYLYKYRQEYGHK